MPISYGDNPSYGGPNPFFDLGNLYGAKKSYANADYIAGPTGYLESDPQSVWTRHTSGWGGGEDPFSKFVQSKQRDVWNAYGAAAANNPNLTHQDFVKNFGMDFFRRQFNDLSEQQRGINSGLYRGRARWTSNG